MKMLTKFESKSSRAKGLAFHPKRPWVLVSLHLLTIQLWDYRMGTLIDRFEDHEGPVRCVDFHPTQPLFVSGGDDYLIRIWSLVTRKCIFTLNGHLDYIRTVFFHKELPWIISCSDDQTIRIWNWQNRQEIACLTGHNHYVMCAQFHPTDDLIVLASLDQTVRVWDISGLRRKHSAPLLLLRLFEDQLQRQQLPQQDIFGNTDAIVKYVLEGHDKGVNWAAFHPTLPLIVSAGDDRLVKLWRMSDTKAWEVDTCRGHTGNVLSAVFHPTEDLILSVSDDKTVRVWDLNKRTPVKQFRREHDRFWLIASHPNINLFATCHDSGVMVFKLERERPAYMNFGKNLFFVNADKQVQMYDYQRDEASLPMLLLKKVGKTWLFMRTLSYNQLDNLILVTYGEGDQGQYALITLPKHVTGAIEPSDIRQGEANFACFILRNRFIAFIKLSKSLHVKDLSNNTTKTIQLDQLVTDVLSGIGGRVLLIKSHSVILYDVQQRKELAELPANGIKYAVWLNDGQHVALLAKHTITIATKDLTLVTSMHETIRIKLAAWDDSGILLYLTLNHIKYTLLNGDTGIIKTLENTVYITKVTGQKVYCLTRAGNVDVITIDPTEYRFKKLLVQKNFAEVLRIIKNSNLVGQNIIAYLQKKGYPEIALQFVEDPDSRFALALECSNLEVALAEAKKIQSKQTWEKLGEEALAQGNTETAEFCYQQLHQFDKLLFLYLLRGDNERLNKMGTIAEHRGDTSLIVQNTLYLGDIKKRCQVYIQLGLHPLAYALARLNGLDELAQQILDEAGIEAKDVQLPAIGEVVPLPKPIDEPITAWPLNEGQISFFEAALTGAEVDESNLDQSGDAVTSQGADLDLIDDDVDQFNDAIEDDFEDDNVDGWDMDDEDLDLEPVEADEAVPSVSAEGENGYWLRNAKTPAEYVAAGVFDQAAQLLHKQVGVVDFEPLRSRFLEVFQALKLYIPGADSSLPSIRTYIRADNDEDNPHKFKPFIPGYDSLEKQLAVGFKYFRENQLEKAIEQFRLIIYTITVITVPDEESEDKCKEILVLAREYILGLLIELERRKVATLDIKRNLELAAYFTRTKLQDAHKVNALQVAMSQSFKNKNYNSALYFAGELLKLVPTGPRAEQAQKMKVRSDSVALDAVDIDFDPYAEFDICAATFTPLYSGSRIVTDSLVGAKYRAEESGNICSITKITQIGVPASGLRIRG